MPTPRWCSRIAIASPGAIATAPTPTPSEEGRRQEREQAGEERCGPDEPARSNPITATCGDLDQALPELRVQSAHELPQRRPGARPEPEQERVVVVEHPPVLARGRLRDSRDSQQAVDPADRLEPERGDEDDVGLRRSRATPP